MTNEERDLITRFIQRVGGVPAASGFAGGSVPATTPPLPPVDREADALIADLFARFPEARYRITQMAFVQEHALMEAQNRINRLEWELNQARQEAAPAQPAASPWGAPMAQQPPPPPPQGRGLFGGLFGGRQAPPPGYQQQPGYQQPAYQQPAYQPPPPQYAPGYQPGMFQRPGGSGFLGSALTTAPGVAGGMVMGNALMNMFSGGHAASPFGSAAAVTPPADAFGASPWSGTPQADPYALGGPPKDDGGWSAPQQDGWSNSASAPGGDTGWQDSSAPADTPTDSGWTDSAGDSGGWSDTDPV